MTTAELAKRAASWNDQYLLTRYALGATAFQDASLFEVIAAEVNRRGLVLPAAMSTANEGPRDPLGVAYAN